MQAQTPENELENFDQTPGYPPSSRDATAQGQLALALFETFSPNKKPLSKAPVEVGYQRSRIFLDTHGVTLAGRRALDVAYFIATQSEENRYVSRFSRDGHKTYIVELEFFRWLMGYTSDNYVHLRGCLRQGQKAAIEVIREESDELVAGPVEGRSSSKKHIPQKESREQWVSVPLLGPVGISRGQVQFQIPKLLEPYIQRPLSFDFLDLRFVFDTLRGRMLYDLLLPSVEEGLTDWVDLDELRKRLDCESKTYQDFRALKAKVIGPAIEDVNRNTNLSAEAQEMSDTGRGKRVVAVRFRVRQEADREKEVSGFGELADRYTTLREEFGLNAAQINEIARNHEEWPPERLQEAMEYTRHKIAGGQVNRSAAGYLMKALREGYVLGSAQLLIESRAQVTGSQRASQPNTDSGQAPKQAGPTATDEALKAQSAAGLRAFEALDQEEAESTWGSYLNTPVARLAASGDQRKLADLQLSHLPEMPLTRHEFGLFVFRRRQTAEASKRDGHIG